MDDHLIDHDLRENRCRQGHQLYGERCEQHVAPDRAVPQQLRKEPAEPKSNVGMGHRIGIPQRRCRRRQEQDFASITRAEFLERARHRLARALFDVRDALAVAVQNDGQPAVPSSLVPRWSLVPPGWVRKFCRLARHNNRCHERRRQARQFLQPHLTPSALQSGRLGRPLKTEQAVGRRKLLERQSRCERNAMQIANRLQPPHKRAGRNQCCVHENPPLLLSEKAASS